MDDSGDVDPTLTVLAELRPARGRRSRTAIDGDTRVAPEVFGMSDVGRIRETNDDRFVIAELDRALLVQHSNFPIADGASVGDNPQGVLLAVADGVGGIGGGELASAIAIDCACAYALSGMPWSGRGETDVGEAMADGFRRTIVDAQQRMREIAEQTGVDPRLGTTLTLAYVAWPELVIVHVGDSRAYLLTNGRLHRLTRDHTLAEALREGGMIDAAKFGPVGVLVNAIGGGSENVVVDVITRRLAPRDVLLLATDGLTHYIDSRELAGCLSADADVESIARSLVDTANVRGGDDNITVVIARF